MVWNHYRKLRSIIRGEKMVKAELIENPEVPKETGLITQDNVPDVDIAIEQ